jgi:hypothetical protein
VTKEQCEETPPQKIFVKDSRATEGRCLHFWARVFQFDQNTGPCNFLAKYGDAPHRRWSDFGDAIVSVEGLRGEGGVVNGVSIPGETCALLAEIVEDDLVEIWGVNVTTESYSTTSGGSNTYTLFAIIDIIKYGSD